MLPFQSHVYTTTQPVRSVNIVVPNPFMTFVLSVENKRRYFSMICVRMPLLICTPRVAKTAETSSKCVSMWMHIKVRSDKVFVSG